MPRRLVLFLVISSSMMLIQHGGQVRALLSSSQGRLALVSAVRHRVHSTLAGSQSSPAASWRQPKPEEKATSKADPPSAQVGTVLAQSGTVRSAYATMRASMLCGAHCVVVQAPSPDNFQFPDTSQLTANHRVLYSAKDDDITTEEVIFGRVKEQTNKARLNKFIGGRIALRRALNAVTAAPGAVNSNAGSSSSIMRDVWGAPHLAPELTGSISHKDFLCVGAAAVDLHGRVGVDLEHCNNKAATTLWRRILTEDEKQKLGGLKSLGVALEEEVLLIFSFKEAVYKAIHPYLARSIDFQEVEVFPELSGTARIVFRLNTGEDFSYRASWERYQEKYWLTCVYVIDDTKKLDPNAKYRGSEKLRPELDAPL